jgi:hypothetical protein
LTVNDLADCAIIRIVLSDPERALEIFQQAKLPVTESDLLVVYLPDGPGSIPQICKALLAAEINIDYAYTLLVGSSAQPAFALHVDAHETAVTILTRQGFMIFTENDLSS